MSNVTRVYLITGFLGSGKTTLLNRIVRRFPKDHKLTVLVNEFGEIGVDGTLLEGEGIDLMEISKGSIFCVCVKTDFIKGLYELNTKVTPDVLLIESTGVADPTDLKRDLQLPIFKNRFQFADQFCVIDAAHFLDAFGAYASIEKQIASSTVFIINKTDVASSDAIKQIKEVIRQFHPGPLFHETAFADIPLDEFLDLEPPAIEALPASTSGSLANLAPEELDEFIDDLLDSPEFEITPPDTLVSVTYRWEGAELDQIRDLARSLPRSVIRAKGFVEEDNRMHLFNYVMGDWTIEAVDLTEDHIRFKNVVVLIGPPEAVDEIAAATETGRWSNRRVFQPFSRP
jgi:G3E family GTPase